MARAKAPRAAAGVTPGKAEFEELWRAGLAVPVWREVLADLETPLGAFAKLDRGGPGFLLESVEGGEVWGRYSIFATEVSRSLVFAGDRAVVHAGRAKPRVLRATDPLAALRELLAPRRSGIDAAPPDARAQMRRVAPPPPFRGGAVGWLGYEAVRHYAKVEPPPKAKGDLEAEAVLLLPDAWAVFDRLRSRIALVADTASARENGATCDAAWKDALSRLAALEKKLARAVPPPRPRRTAFARADFSVSDRDFCAAVERAQEYVRAGDVIQVVLSRRREGTFAGDPFDAYRALRLVNPSPYMFFFRAAGSPTLAGSSPEALVRVQNGRLTTRPIAGTRPRGRDADEDARLGLELARDEKERAEHLMLVDLGRNDLGRVAAIGSVSVPSFMRIERYSHVMHLVSDVTATLGPARDALDAVESVFPAGTLSGAPKVRAMQIVAELEQRRRGVYGGLVGWFGVEGDADTCIAIRTVSFPRPNRYVVQAGAGIVYDSVPQKEADETRAKSEGVLKALELAAKGL